MEDELKRSSALFAKQKARESGWVSITPSSSIDKSINAVGSIVFPKSTRMKRKLYDLSIFGCRGDQGGFGGL